LNNLVVIIRPALYVFIHRGTGEVLYEYDNEDQCLDSVGVHCPELNRAMARRALNTNGVEHPIGTWKRL